MVCLGSYTSHINEFKTNIWQLSQIVLSFVEVDAVFQISFNVGHPKDPTVAAPKMNFHFALFVRGNVVLSQSDQYSRACIFQCYGHATISGKAYF
ncbi:MAG: hypothetical protein ACI815_001231 [Psychroserpens sp.]|jgi:hypothetical protein